MSDIKQQKGKAKNRLFKAREAILQSSQINRSLAHFLGVFLSFPRSALNYEVIFKSQAGIGRACKYKVNEKDYTCSTAKKYLALLVRMGAIEKRTMGRKEASLWLWMKYDYKFTGQASSHRHNFYVINWDHPLWTGGEIDKEDNAHRPKQSSDTGDLNHAKRGEHGRFESLNRGANAPVEPGCGRPENVFTKFSPPSGPNPPSKQICDGLDGDSSPSHPSQILENGEPLQTCSQQVWARGSRAPGIPPFSNQDSSPPAHLTRENSQ